MIDSLKEFFKNNLKFYSYEELCNIFSTYNKEDIAQALTILEEDLFIKHNAKNEFGLLKLFNLIKGTLSVKQAGYGFIDSEDDHMFVPYEKMDTAIDGDIVVGKLTEFKGKPEAHIERIIQRGHNEFYGKVIIFHKKHYLQLFEDVIINDLIINDNESIKFKVGDYVKCGIIKYLGKGSVSLKVVVVLGDDSTNFMDFKMILASYHLNTTFSVDTIEEVSKLPLDIDISDYPNRLDLTNKYIVTIDGADAKDFDDAISVEKLSDGTFELGVYIADVSHYVKDDSFIDIDAMSRTTSIYLPNEVIPMLPFELSDGLCSLQENKYRLVLSLIMKINSKGDIIDYSFNEGIIKSKHRLTYEGVNKYLEGDSKYIEEYADIKDLIYPALELQKILYNKRKENGAFNFESNEAKIILNSYGDVDNIIPIERGISEGIIEEFMITANECIATHFNYTMYPFIYRIHTVPDDERIKLLINKLNAFNLSYKIKGKDLSYLLKDIIIDLDNNTDIDKTVKAIINNEIIRSFPKAIYSTTNIGHFGLGLKNYTHFTSPIRRYPDLMVHRMLKRCFIHPYDETISLKYYENKLNEMALISSKLERTAEKVERDVEKYYNSLYMSHHIGEVFEGVISSITSFGIYVALDNYVEGLSKYDNMKGYITYDEATSSAYNTQTGVFYHLGDKVRVSVIDSYPIYRTIDFKILNNNKGIINEKRR